MAAVHENLEKILSARYGEEVRGAIHDSIEDIYDYANGKEIDTLKSALGDSIYVGTVPYTSSLYHSIDTGVDLKNGDSIIVFPLIDESGKHDYFTFYGALQDGSYEVLATISNIGDFKTIDIAKNYSNVRIVCALKNNHIENGPMWAAVMLKNGKQGFPNVLISMIKDCNNRLDSMNKSIGEKAAEVPFDPKKPRGIFDTGPVKSGEKCVFYVNSVSNNSIFNSYDIYGSIGSSFELIKSNITTLGEYQIVDAQKDYDFLRILVSTSEVSPNDSFFVVFGKTTDDSILGILARTVLNINEIRKDLSFVESDKIECYCPTMYAIVGHEINIYYDNIFKTNNINNYQIYTTVSDEGDFLDWIQQMNEGIRFTPKSENVGTHRITIRAQRNGKDVLEYSFNLVVKGSNIPTIKVMFLGDSHTNNAFYVVECKSMFDDNMTLYGTLTKRVRNSSGDYIDVNHEGRSGWSTHTYCTTAGPDHGFNNPFYNNGFDFSYYMSSHREYSDLTDVVVFLGSNEWSASNEDSTSRMQKMIDSIHSYNRSIRVHVATAIPPCVERYADTTSLLNYNHKDKMWEIAKSYSENLTGCTIAALGPVIHRKYGWDWRETDVASKLNVNVERPTDFLHPSRGYYQMAEELFAELVSNSQY